MQNLRYRLVFRFYLNHETFDPTPTLLSRRPFATTPYGDQLLVSHHGLISIVDADGLVEEHSVPGFAAGTWAPPVWLMLAATGDVLLGVSHRDVAIRRTLLNVQMILTTRWLALLLLVIFVSATGRRMLVSSEAIRH